MARADAIDRVGRLLRRITALWALGGGVLIAFVVVANAWSVVSDKLFMTPLPGTYEIAQVGVGVAMFMFLPYCQITGSNVTADIFTAGLSRRWQALLTALGCALATAFAILLVWRMSYGLIDFRVYRETTAIYQFPHWIAFIPILVSLVLLTVSAAVNFLEAASGRVIEGGEASP
jgi:TRAP-type C4-dicarboxylate transport system permease small subunit